ncbi:hypothetical protein NQ317_007465 [Molorchus minor]|uniref:Uncharacterized protein n=1 Tax=Molorchus minor TaxID=1323400 RepID=A0ABQ9K3R9_9CUCU|nr:hypothetical protein NQ317_007465 [Molorchus minor]
MKIFLVLAHIILVTATNSDEEQWQQFKAKYHKKYKSILHDTTRFQNFQHNLRTIEKHNEQYDKGLLSYKLGITKFADLTQQEFEKRLNSVKGSLDDEVFVFFPPLGDGEVPDEIDWTTEGAVTDVKDQRGCIASWAFAAVGALESHYFRHSGELITLSEQFLIDCNTRNNYGCGGGTTLNAFVFMRDSGIVPEESYPYRASDGKCKSNGTMLKDIGFVAVQSREDELKNAVGLVGPIAVSIDVSELRLYTGGVYENPKCRDNVTNHQAVVVGYGTTRDGIDYWLIKNSWGTDWGEDGYLRLVRNKNNHCGVTNDAIYPFVYLDGSMSNGNVEEELYDEEMLEEISVEEVSLKEELKSIMKFLVILASVVLAINAATDEELWTEFKKNHGREYRNLREEQYRFSIFQKNLRRIEEHNAKYEQGESSYYMGVTQFADKSKEEFRSMLNYSRSTKPQHERGEQYQVSNLALPSEVNWVTQGVVTPVKNQGNCGSCWAFASTGSMEGAYAISTGRLVSLSEQNLVDCSTSYGNAGCDGGVMDYAFIYVRDNGIEAESDYPYTGTDGRCSYDSSKSVLKVNSWYDIPQGDESALQDAVANTGPVAVALNADGYDLYAGGIYDDSSCSTEVNHGVLVAGYGTESGTEYWLVKNSWGADFGENGYIRHARNKNSQCGITVEATIPAVA